MDTKLTRRAFVGGAALTSLVACGGKKPSGTKTATSEGNDGAAADGKKVIIRMVADTGGVHDQSFNQLSWQGLQELEKTKGWSVNYLESKQTSDFSTNLDKCVDEDATLVWGVGFGMADDIKKTAKVNPDVKFALVDNTFEEAPSNLVGVVFKQEECSFVVGYIAARVSKTGKVGFVGGMDSDVIQSFEQGFFAGVEYANKVKGLKVEYQGQMTESFSDQSLGKSTAQKMITNGCDVLYHAAGATGIGMIDACKEANVYAIGVDRDQSDLAPENVIASAIKRVDQAVIKISDEFVNDKVKGGTNIVLGAEDDAVGIAPTHDVLDKIDPTLYEEANKLFDKIKAGEIVVPATADKLKEFVAKL